MKMKYDVIVNSNRIFLALTPYFLVLKMKNKIKIIFIGTGEVGGLLLESLFHHPHFQIDLVVTGEDKPAGRKMELQASDIKKRALKLGLPVYQPANIKRSEAIEKLKSLAPDLIIVMAYGQILSQEVLDIPNIECLNIHASLLPKYRGASPIQSAILKGEKKTGISLMRMLRKMDAGPVFQQFEVLIDGRTAGELEEKISQLSAECIPEALIQVTEGKLKAEDQNEDEVTYVHKISKSDGAIDWNEPVEIIERKIRAYNPWPSAYTFFKGKRLKIYLATIHDDQLHGRMGMTFKWEGRVVVLVRGGMVELKQVQLEGKNIQTIKEFLNGNPDFIGTTLESSY